MAAPCKALVQPATALQPSGRPAQGLAACLWVGLLPASPLEHLPVAVQVRGHCGMRLTGGALGTLLAAAGGCVVSL